MHRQWIVDASPVILLAKADHIDLLPACCDQLGIPEDVADEIMRADDIDPARQWVEEEGRSFICETGRLEPAVAAWDLGRGESHVLSWGAKNPRWTVVVDDGMARRCAEGLSIPVIGTLGVLLVAKQDGILREVRSPLASLIRAGLYVDEALVRRVLHLANES